MPITIFPNSSFVPSEQTESKKISYWLEKLFNQEEEKKQRETEANESISRSPPERLLIDKSPKEKGLDEVLKNNVKKEETDRKTIEHMVSNSNRIIISTTSIFPFDIFPSTINVEDTRITIIHRQLFASQVHSVDIKDISNVFIDTGLLFAVLTIVSRTFIENENRIIRLRKKEAVIVRRVIEGLRMFVKENIDTTNYTIEELTEKLKELSTTKIVL